MAHIALVQFWFSHAFLGGSLDRVECRVPAPYTLRMLAWYRWQRRDAVFPLSHLKPIEWALRQAPPDSVALEVRSAVRYRIATPEEVRAMLEQLAFAQVVSVYIRSGVGSVLNLPEGRGARFIARVEQPFMMGAGGERVRRLAL